MRSKDYLENIKSSVEFSLSGGYNGSLDINNSRAFNANNPSLGYCYKYETSSTLIYKICTSPIGIERTDFRILMHEIGHIYLRHLDYSQEYDDLVINAIKNNRQEIEDYVNTTCGIDWANKLLDRIINDPMVNHDIHNIAMDMEVNSNILSLEDIEEMESDISSVLPDYEADLLKNAREQVKDQQSKENIDKALKEWEKRSKIKLISPSRYHFKDGTSWPEGLSYVEYLELIMENLDQFIKMMVSISMGGNGDTGNISKEDIENALKQNGPGQGQGGGDELDKLLQGSGQNSGSGSNSQSGPGNNDDNPDTDHKSGERDQADEERTSNGGTGQGGGHIGNGSFAMTQADEVDMALNEIIRFVHKKVVKTNYKKDPMYLYNRGINRSVILPAMRTKYSYDTDPRIVFLIDVSGSMPSALISRFINTINNHLKKINGGLKYDLIEWDTALCNHSKDLDPKKPIGRIHCGGGTWISSGIEYFHKNYGEEAILVIASDFYDDLNSWAKAESKMSGYTIFGLDYGTSSYKPEMFKNIKVKKIPYSR